MASIQQPAQQVVAPSRRPVATWALMVLILVLALLILGGALNGLPGAAWVLVAPSILGLLGAWLAARKDAPGWMVASGFWGIGSIPALIVILTLVGGP